MPGILPLPAMSRRRAIQLGAAAMATALTGPCLAAARQAVSGEYTFVVAGLDYRRLGLTNNSLVRITGTRTSFDALGGGAGFRVRWSGIELRLEGGAHRLLQLPTTSFSVDLLLGFTNPS